MSLSTPSFVTHALPRTSTSQVLRSSPRCVLDARRDAPATASPSGTPPKPPAQRKPQPRPRTSAPATTSDTSAAPETHHWVVVRAAGARAFEAAAISHAKVASLAESRRDASARPGAERRWLLRAAPDEGHPDHISFVSMEAFRGRSTPDTSAWVDAVRAARGAFGAVDIHSMEYERIFRCRRAAQSGTAKDSVVVFESVNVGEEDAADMEAMLKRVAEASVYGGEAMEFSVLRGKKLGFFKTVVVYENNDELERHHRGTDRVLDRNFQRRRRHVFTPVVFG